MKRVLWFLLGAACATGVIFTLLQREKELEEDRNFFDDELDFTDEPVCIQIQEDAETEEEV